MQPVHKQEGNYLTLGDSWLVNLKNISYILCHVETSQNPLETSVPSRLNSFVGVLGLSCLIGLLDQQETVGTNYQAAFSTTVLKTYWAGIYYFPSVA